MAFQIIDDVLDLVSTTESLGKPVGNDIREGVYSLPVLLALDGPDGGALRPRLGGPTDDAPSPTPSRWCGPRDGVTLALDRARLYNDEAAAALAVLPAGPARDGLASLPATYLERTLRRRPRTWCSPSAEHAAHGPRSPGTAR